MRDQNVSAANFQTRDIDEMMTEDSRDQVSVLKITEPKKYRRNTTPR